MKIPEGSIKGKQSTKGNSAIEPNLECYDYPSSGINKARNEQLAKIQIERLRAEHLTAEGYSDIPTLHSGYYINIENHPSLDTMDVTKPWLIIQIKHKAYQPQVLEAFGGESSAKSTTLPSQIHKYLDPNTSLELEFPIQNQQQGYFNVFNSIPQEVPYRPQHTHPKPKLLGSQTAIVTGAAGEEIYCKVPYELPANKTRSVFKTSSSKGVVGSNELRIEDKAGQEQIFVQSQKDFDQLTKNNHTVQVLNNSHLQVNNEHSETIVGQRTTTNQSEEHHLTEKDRKTQLLANDNLMVGESQHTTIGTIYTSQAGTEIILNAGQQIVIDGGLSLSLKAGGQHTF